MKLNFQIEDNLLENKPKRKLSRRPKEHLHLHKDEDERDHSENEPKQKFNRRSKQRCNILSCFGSVLCFFFFSCNVFSTFLLLYPTGIGIEVSVIYVALPFIKVVMVMT